MFVFRVGTGHFANTLNFASSSILFTNYAKCKTQSRDLSLHYLLNCAAATPSNESTNEMKRNASILFRHASFGQASFSGASFRIAPWSFFIFIGWLVKGCLLCFDNSSLGHGLFFNLLTDFDLLLEDVGTSDDNNNARNHNNGSNDFIRNSPI